MDCGKMARTINPRMKNFIQSVVSSTKQKKFSVSNDYNSSRKNYMSDSLVDELHISLKAYETSSNHDRVVYDCNRNNVTENPQLKRGSFRRKSWRKKSTSKKDKDRIEKESGGTATTVDECNDTDQTDNCNICTDISETDLKVSEKTKSRKKSHQRSQSTGENKFEKQRRNSSFDSLKGTPQTERRKLRRYSTNTRTNKTGQILSEDQASSFEIVDFGRCYIPYEMKSWTFIQHKLSSWGNRTNSPKLSTSQQQQQAKRNFSFSESITEPAYQWVTNTLPTTLKRNRKKSYEFQRRQCESNSSTENLDDAFEKHGENTHEVSLTREMIDPCFITDFDVSFSSNVWYYGELIIQHDTNEPINSSTDTIDTIDNENDDDDQSKNKHISSLLEQDSKNTGTLIVRLDKHGDVVYSLTYHFENNVYVGSVPFEDGKYCLDFTDFEQPRFSSAKFLLAYLIDEKYLQRVTFAWLLENCYSLLT